MYPDILFLGLSLYEIFILIGIIMAFLVLRLYTDKIKAPVKLFNFVLIIGFISIIVGYLSAVLFQMIYHFQETGVWEVSGATFYGGLIGGAASFFILYFGLGHFIFKKKEHISSLKDVISIGIICVVIAHAFGRIGCLMAGCCHGKLTDAFYGINMYATIDGVYGLYKIVPTQLFEAIFLFLLFILLSFLFLKKKNDYITSFYLIGYGIFRFIIEYFRGDDERGASLVSFLSPSQFTAIIMIVVGIGLIFLYKYYLKGLLIKIKEREEERENA